MKQCSGCRRVLPVTEFFFKSREAGTRHTLCKECNNIYCREHYHKNPVQYRRYHYLNTARYRTRNRQRVYQYLAGRCCADCSEADPMVLEFDHINGTKSANISDMVSGAFSWQRILKEIEKCEIRCANCHRRKTARDFKWFRGDIGA